MKPRRRNILLIVILILLAGGWYLLAGPSSAQTASDGDGSGNAGDMLPDRPLNPVHAVSPFTVGVLLPENAKRGELARSVMQGAMLATKEIQRDALKENVRAWFKLETLEIARDTDSVTLAARVEVLDIDALVCGLEHREGQCFFDVCQGLKMPLMTFNCVSPELSPDRWVFGMGLTPEAEGRAMAVFAYEDLGNSRAGVVFDAGNAGFTAMASSFRETFESLGGNIANETDGEKLFTLNATGSEGLSQAYGEDSDGRLFQTSGFNPESYVARVKGFNKRYEKLYRGIYEDEDEMPPPGRYAALAYDAVWLLADAHRRSHSTLGEELKAALSQTRDFPGVTGALSFDELHNCLRDVTILELTGEGPVFVATIPRD